MDTTFVGPLHKYPHYIQDCCDLINSEWKRSRTARLRSLDSSCDTLPVCLILVKDNKLIGHLKLTPFPKYKEGCFVESVVIDKQFRGQGFGTFLMKYAEEYCKNVLNLSVVYLSTKGQEGFYSKLGYVECKPISIYGNHSSFLVTDLKFVNTKKNPNLNPVIDDNAPKPPPMPPTSLMTLKTFMKKNI